MEGVGQAEAFGKGLQGLSGTLAVKCTGFHVAKPTVGITAPPVWAHFLHAFERSIDNLLGLLSLAVVK